MTHVLATHGINIQELYPHQMEVPFKGPWVDDIFYVTKDGLPLSSGEQASLKEDFDRAFAADTYKVTSPP